MARRSHILSLSLLAALALLPQPASAELICERTLFYRNRALGQSESGGGAVHYKKAGTPWRVF